MDRVYSDSSVSSTASSESSAPYADIERGSNQALIRCKPPSYDETVTKATGLHRRPSGRGLAVAALILSTVCLVLLALGAAFVFFFLRDRLGVPDQASRVHEEVCLPCVQIRPNPLADVSSPLLDVLDVRYDGDDNETEICCAQTPTQYASLFKLILQRQEEVKKLADVLGPANPPEEEGEEDFEDQHDGVASIRPVSAHLVLKPPTTNTVPQQAVQRWKSAAESPMSHVRAGLRFEDNKIYVITPGLYFVYCQILYNGAADMPHRYQVASTYVERHSLSFPASSGILLKTRHTRYQKVDRHSSYVAGLFFLHKGDQLFVKVSVPEVVSRDDRASFFGLFRVGA